MRLHRGAPGIAAGILAPALLLTTPSFAATAAPTAVTVPAVSSSRTNRTPTTSGWP
ncbi:hypothetical protein [Streptomyces cyaneofuscatus]|uniref:hypothetical protein n=1 Tax=Streptomyces cyaneofuscatus TaxID=66883 RepID=UPI00364E6DD0